MFRNQANSIQPELNHISPYNWLAIQPIQQMNYFAQPYFISIPQVTEPDFNRSVCYLWAVPCSSLENQKEEQEHQLAVHYDDALHSKEVKNLSQNFSAQVRQVKKTEKKRRKIIQLQNIKQNERNRNILSNCLKLAIKSIRNTLQQQQSYFNKIVMALKLNYTIGEFFQKLDSLLPMDINYIRPAMLKQMFEVQQQSFTTVLKILIKKFFKQEIYTSSGKNTAMKKLIKAQHIKAGRRLLEYLYGQKTISQSEERI